LIEKEKKQVGGGASSKVWVVQLADNEMTSSQV